MRGANESQTKSVVSIAEMARMVGLSRARFNQLIGTTFPWPRYMLSNHRPFYDEELQQLCLEVRRRNFGIDGKPVLFYAKRIDAAVPVRKPKKTVARDDKHADLIDSIKGLGLVAVTAAQVSDAVKQLYPQGMPEGANGEVLRAVFLHLRRQNSSDNLRK